MTGWISLQGLEYFTPRNELHKRSPRHFIQTTTDLGRSIHARLFLRRFGFLARNDPIAEFVCPDLSPFGLAHSRFRDASRSCLNSCPPKNGISAPKTEIPA